MENDPDVVLLDIRMPKGDSLAWGRISGAICRF